jgi:RecA/RadA recombinase
MSKFNLDSVVETVQKSMKKDDRRAGQFGTGDKLSKISDNPEDFVVMPEWFEESYGVLGLQFGRIFQWAGRSDSGKTSFAIVAMKAAQEQGFGVIYVETEGKTTTADLEAWGVDPAGVMLVKTAITEEAFDGAFKLWDAFFKKYPNDKLLFIYDSYGNTVSQGDSEIDMTKKVGRVGGAAKTNRLGINTMIAKMQEDPVAVLFINYTYANMGAPGRVNARGS